MYTYNQFLLFLLRCLATSPLFTFQKHNAQNLNLVLCGVFLGYDSHQKGYRCYNPSTKKTYVTMDVTFLETESFFRDTTSFQGKIQMEKKNWWEISDVIIASGGVQIDGVSALPSATMNVEQEDMECGQTGSKVSEQIPSREGQVLEEPSLQEQLSPSSLVPDPTLEEISEVTFPTTCLHDDSNISVGYKLPAKHNRGKPPEPILTRCWRKEKSTYPITNYVSTEKLSDPLRAFVSNVSSLYIPGGVQDALKDPKWIQAMKKEMEALQKNNTWKLMELPKGKKTVGCKWVFSIKYKADGSIERYKARLVAKGYIQTYGVDSQETFSHVEKLNTVRVLLSLAANLDWPLHQINAKNAFLHGDFEEDIYMDIPLSYSPHSQPGLICKLERSLYGLKPSPRAWFGRFSVTMKKYGYVQSDSDHTLFLRRSRGKITVLIIYVDDMIITGDDQEEIVKLQQKLSTEFEMKNLEGRKYFLGIEVARSKRGIFLSQRKYILDLLAEVGMLDCKPADTPIVQNHRLREYSDQMPINKERYQRLVGKLIYLSHTRPDIAYVVSVVSQFMHAPSEDHMDCVMRIIRYLKGAPGRGLQFQKSGHLKIEGFTDADWAESVLDRRSTSGYFTFVGWNLVTWRSKKQKVVALSSAEAKFRGMAKGPCEFLWLRKLMTELSFAPMSEIELFSDNKTAIDIYHNPVQHDRTKHN